MRYRVKDYAIRVTAGRSSVRVYFKNPLSTFNADAIKEAIRLVVDEDAKEVFCSSMQKDKIGNIAQDSSTVSGFDTYIAFGYPSGKTISNSDKFTIEMDWGDEPTGLSGGDDAHNLASFFGITEAMEYTALTPAEAIAIARDCQYNVMGTDWPIPTWLPTGVTEAQVESAAEGLGIPYHEPTQTA